MVGKGGLPPLVECDLLRGQATLPDHEPSILDHYTQSLQLPSAFCFLPTAFCLA